MIYLRKFLACILAALPLLAAGFFDAPTYAADMFKKISSKYNTSSETIEEGVQIYRVAVSGAYGNSSKFFSLL